MNGALLLHSRLNVHNTHEKLLAPSSSPGIPDAWGHKGTAWMGRMQVPPGLTSALPKSLLLLEDSQRVIWKPVGLDTREGGRVSKELAYSPCQGLEYVSEQDTCAVTNALKLPSCS